MADCLDAVHITFSLCDRAISILDGTMKCVFIQWFVEVFLNPGSKQNQTGFLYQLIILFHHFSNAVLSRLMNLNPSLLLRFNLSKILFYSLSCFWPVVITLMCCKTNKKGIFCPTYFYCFLLNLFQLFWDVLLQQTQNIFFFKIVKFFCFKYLISLLCSLKSVFMRFTTRWI